METKTKNCTDDATEFMIAADGTHLMEEFAMVHVHDLATRLEKEYGRFCPTPSWKVDAIKSPDPILFGTMVVTV